MAMNDTVSDMLTRIRNALTVNRKSVDVIASRLNRSVAEVLEREGYIMGARDIMNPQGHAAIRLLLKYDHDGDPVISKIDRVSRPGCRVYREARTAGVGGEILCELW